MPVFLTERVLKNMARTTYDSVPGIIAKDSKGTKHDVDIAASCDGHLVLCECKTLDNIRGNESLPSIMRQIEEDYDLAQKVHASVFCISTLANLVPTELGTFLKRKNGRRERPLVILLTLNDLEQGWLPASCVQYPHANATEIPVRIEVLLSWGRKNGFSPTM